MAMGPLPQSCGSVGGNTPRGLVSGVGCYSHGRITAGPKVALSQSFVGNATKRRYSRPGALRVQATSGGSPDPWATKYPAWDSIQRELTSVYGIKSLSAQEAAAMVEAGEAILLDVRLEEAHEEAHPEGAINAPAFRIIKNGDAAGGGGFSRVLKSLVLRVNGVTPTEVCLYVCQFSVTGIIWHGCFTNNNCAQMHPEFPSMASMAAENGKKSVILACEAGGSMAATSTFPTGKASRSLKAAWKLLHTKTLPAEKVYHLEGGVIGWYQAGYPMNGDYDVTKAYNTPNAVDNRAIR